MTRDLIPPGRSNQRPGYKMEADEGTMIMKDENKPPLSLQSVNQEAAEYRGHIRKGGSPSSDEAPDDKKEQTKKKWRPRLITIEPVLFLYLFAGGLQGPAFNALIYRKVCLMGYPEATCLNLHNATFHAEEDIVQKGTSYWFLWQNLCFEIPSILLSFVYGALSDHVGRRVVIAFPAIGQIISVVTFAMNARYMESHVGYMLIGGVFSGFSGGWITLFLASFSYLGEVTSVKDRTKRVFIAEGVAGLSVGISYVLSGIILDHTNFIFVFSLSATLYGISVIYVFLYIKEPPKDPEKMAQPYTSKSSFYWNRFKGAFTTVFKKREGSGRSRVIVCLLIVLFNMISMNAIYTVGYLFLKRRPLSWSQTTYGVFVAVFRFVPSTVLLTVIQLLKSKLHLRDTTLMMMGLLSGSVSEFYMSFCTRTWMVFLVPFLACFKDAGTVLRSTLSQLVEPEELGRMYAALGALQSVSGLVGSSIFNTVYPLTLNFWPGFCFTLGTLLAGIPLSMMCWLRKDMKKTPTYPPTGSDMDLGLRAPLMEDEDADEVNDETQVEATVL